MTQTMTDDACWQAIQTRDAAFDGQFYYAVTTTGIYCRPSCPSRRAKREHVQYFADLSAAQAAGFRACLRCKPGEVGAAQRVVAQLQGLLDTAEPVPTLAQLGQAVGLSPFYVQRMFKAALGVSPKQYALGRRGERLKAELRAGSAVTTAMYDAGHPSSRTLYDPATDQLGMPPSSYRRGGAGQQVFYTVVQSVLGPMLVAATGRGLCSVRFGDAAELVAELRAEYPQAELLSEAAPLQPYLTALHAELAGRPAAALNLPRDAAGTDFQRRVWEALRGIPAGETRSYADVAALIGEPNAVRAVARACASNPLALVVPCHRVVRRGGELGGYRWGVERKRALLEGEQRARQNAAQPA
ncbi:bifunctional DNA-binding transcriptional regulator/O6-methylguanine-DNA methyltransferase Ada [Deinococcus ruber]|uniref:methylated-DNA--[protein]-cysteine S-methyltransferase n=1 Tax=Deinococcus ruber TaxID=1848197 RepID=A0A918C743_9DEIO|nr:bifunctional DNA-binding transcriptional regulator/O6-methylguanine-DNA methyltransferase Ada [Deinococcus ruber]GGR08957.1 bifunctional transcriptional activator/DNA repair enzyme protein Ada [Deinococcus ruber]